MAMPLPMTKSAMDRLGKRLVVGIQVSENDFDELAQLVVAYQLVLEAVKDNIIGLGYRPTTRVKTRSTLVDKLRRETARLSQVQDLAGARIVVRDQVLQDKARDTICERFESLGCSCKVIDRRQHPSFGYRAIHVIVYWDQIPVEVQIRTELQDTWAQIVERLGDRWGRGLRYGEEPEEPNARVDFSGVAGTRREAMQRIAGLSDSIADIENVRARLLRIARIMSELPEIMHKFEQRSDGDPARDPNAFSDILEAFRILTDSSELVEEMAQRDQLTLREVLDVVLPVLQRSYDDAILRIQALETNLRNALQVFVRATEHE